MMRLGIFAKTFVRPTLGETLDAVKAHGLDCVQFNMACAGLPPMPRPPPSDRCIRITVTSAAAMMAWTTRRKANIGLGAVRKGMKWGT